MVFEVDLVVIDDNEFNKWVDDKLDQALGQHPTVTSTPMPTAVLQAQTQVPNYLHLSQLLATTVGQGMMHFTQAVAPAGGGHLGTGSTLEAGKGFNRNQVARLKDACGVMQVKDIPTIRYVIQSTKGKAYDIYRDHITKAITSWCHMHNMERDKFIFLKQQFLDDLVKLRFNPGGCVAQYESSDKGISMLVCRSLSASEVEHLRGYEEASELTWSMRQLDEVLNERSKTTMPA